MFCRAGNLAGQQVTSSGRHRPLPLEHLFGGQTGAEAGSQGTPRSAQACPILPVADGLRQVREPVGARPLPRRQPAEGDAGVAAAGKGMNAAIAPCSAQHGCRCPPGLRARAQSETQVSNRKNGRSWPVRRAMVRPHVFHPACGLPCPSSNWERRGASPATSAVTSRRQVHGALSVRLDRH
jgi:hypothetical protein